MEYFPYSDFRENQEEFIDLVDSEVSKGKNLVVEASTGFGKTACVLAAILPIAMEKNKKVVYLCRTHKQMDRVIEELKMISAKHNISAVALRGRREMCLSPLVLNHTTDSSTSMYVCRLLRKMKRCNHFNNTREHEDKAYEMEVVFSSRPTFSQEIKDACKAEAFCPYEIAKAVMRNAQVIACSYMYLFQPDIRDGFLEGIGVNLDDIIVIMDEAHNLPDMAIELGSCQVSLSALKSGIREAREHNEESIAQFLELTYKAVNALDAKYSLKVDEEARILPVELLTYYMGGQMPFLPEKNLHTLEEFIGYVVKQGEEMQKEMLKRGKPPRSYVHSCGAFLHNWLTLRSRDDFCYLIQKYRTKMDTESVRLEIVDLDPRNITTQVTDNSFSVVAMSGTLSPLVAYAETIGLKNFTTKAFPSPFQRENIMVLAARGVTTKGNERGLEMYRKIASKAAEVVNSTPKNVGIFAPSYEVLDGVLSAGLKYIIDKPLFVESRAFSSEDNDRLIREFKDHEKHGGGVLLGVLGGRNAEGQDYPGDEMNCVVLLGIPYARPTSRVKAQIDYYSKVFPNRGKYYGYYLPAHRKFNQGAGRAHRMLQDKAAIVFLDYRVLQPFVKNDISEWIKRSMIVVDDRAGVIAERLRSFF
ncbi:MAG: DEAD/DEAH box helicase family protein [Candidatus Methanofastidiosa archaeon]|nr:DEAD/DEAH box helicase family protein [Candidatus Methanofastidiosa archaeon]